jgi:hypothetical protein
VSFLVIRERGLAKEDTGALVVRTGEGSTVALRR